MSFINQNITKKIIIRNILLGKYKFNQYLFLGLFFALFSNKNRYINFLR